MVSATLAAKLRMRSGPTEFDFVSLSLKLPTEAEADVIFNALAEDGKVTMLGYPSAPRRPGGIAEDET